MAASRILLVQPPIYDFTAFDYFLYPLGLLKLAGRLKRMGLDPDLVDALDRYEKIPSRPGLKRPTFRDDGCGHFHRAVVPPPSPLKGIPRRYHRFGLPAPLLKERMARKGQPSAVAVTCTMTYWYPGVIEVVGLARELWPRTPVLLGGIYATLCPDHARSACGADALIQGRDLSLLAQFFPRIRPDPATYPAPSHELMPRRESAAVQATIGCPRRCPYCASSTLEEPFHRRDPAEVAEEIAFLVDGLERRRIAFYDDALLEGGTAHLLELTGAIMAKGLHRKASFHCPNGLSARALTPDVAKALRACNFQTLRIGFETADPSFQSAWGGKAVNPDLEQAAESLAGAGFSPCETGVYLLAGLPGQDRAGIEESIRFVHATGFQARLAEYAPVPGTPYFKEAEKESLLDLKEPLNHNKTLAPFRFKNLGPEDFRALKDLAGRLNRDLLHRS